MDTRGGISAQTIIALGPHLGITLGEKGADEVLFQTRQRLQALPGKTLWVIDNLSDLDQLNGLLSQTGKISLLVTSQDSRESVIPGGVDFRPIGVLDKEPAVRLLCEKSRHDPTQPVFSEIVEKVGRLPRAVEALGVQLDLTGETPERLLEALRAAPNPLEFDRFQNQAPGLAIPRNESLFNALRGPVVALPPNIREALAPLGYTADLPITMPLVEELTGLSGGDLINFFDECEGKSVLSATNDQVTLHSLTAAVIAATNPDFSFQTALGRAGTRIGTFLETRNLVNLEEMGHYDCLLSQALPNLNLENQENRVFLNNLAAAYNSAGRSQDSIRLHQINLEFVQRVLGPEHRDTLGSRNNLAAAYRNAGTLRIFRRARPRDP